MSDPLGTVAEVGTRRWNPWRALRERSHLELAWGWFPEGTRGRIEDVWPPPCRRITLHAGLGRVDRNSSLAHELVHDERGLLPKGCPPGIREKDEAAVRREVARRLVPLDELRELARVRTDLGEPVTLLDVCEHFDVPEHVARLACELVR